MNTPLNAALETIDSVTDETNLVIAAKCRSLLRGYAVRWHDDIGDFIPTGVEKIYATRLFNPTTGSPSTVMATAGKIDLEYRRKSNGATGILDHKSTGEDIEDPTSTFWSVQSVESQWSHYMLLCWTFGIKIDEATIDVIRKPLTNPKQFKSKAEKAAIIASRKYYNCNVSDSTLEYLQESDKENLELYEHRLTDDCINVRPNYYYARRPVPRLDSELMDYAAGLWDSSQMILEARRKNRWPKHSGSCVQYGSPCMYLGICSGFSTPDGPQWKQREKVHSELSDDQDRNTLTYSSIRCHESCPRRFYWRYEKCIEKADREESEALQMGTMLHLALEHYWLALLPEGEKQEIIIPTPINTNW